MTAANAPGYPDFQAAPNVLAKELINTSIAIPNAIPLQIFKGAIPQYRHTFVGIGPTTGFFTLIVRPYDPFFSSLPLIEHRFICVAGITTMLIPNIFSGIELDVFASSIPGGETVFWQMAYTNGYSDGYHWLNGPNAVSSGNISVPANSSLTFPLPQVQPGPAQVWFQGGGVAGNVGGFVGVYKTDGTLGDTIAEFDPLVLTENNTVYLPPEPAFVGLFNTTAGALTSNCQMRAVGGLY